VCWQFGVINAELPTHEANAIFYRYRQGENTGDAAKRIGVNRRSLSRYLCTGIKELRNFLAQDEDGIHKLCSNDKQAS